MLYLAGYLTTEDTDDPNSRLVRRRLRLPNREVAEVFRTEIVERYAEEAGGYERLDDLHNALIAGDADGVGRELGRILLTTPSCRDLTSENSYHMLVAGLLFGIPGYADPMSNRERGDGYFDLQLVPEGKRGAGLPVITIELKVAAKNVGDFSPEALHGLAHKALAQIAEKRYDVGERGLRYGIAFQGKNVAAVCERE